MNRSKRWLKVSAMALVVANVMAVDMAFASDVELVPIAPPTSICSGESWPCPPTCEVGEVLRSEARCSQPAPDICCLYIVAIYRCRDTSSNASCGNAGVLVGDIIVQRGRCVRNGGVACVSNP